MHTGVPQPWPSPAILPHWALLPQLLVAGVWPAPSDFRTYPRPYHQQQKVPESGWKPALRPGSPSCHPTLLCPGSTQPRLGCSGCLQLLLQSQGCLSLGGGKAKRICLLGDSMIQGGWRDCLSPHSDSATPVWALTFSHLSPIFGGSPLPTQVWSVMLSGLFIPSELLGSSSSQALTCSICQSGGR